MGSQHSIEELTDKSSCYIVIYQINLNIPPLFEHTTVYEVSKMSEVSLLHLSGISWWSRFALYFTMLNMAIGLGSLIAWSFLSSQGTSLLWLSVMWVIAIMFAAIGAVNHLILTVLELNQIVYLPGD